MIPAPSTLGNPQQDPFQTQRRGWRPLRKTHYAALKHTVRGRCSLLSFRMLIMKKTASDLARMIVVVFVQGCGKPNQRTRNRTRLSLRYHNFRFNAMNHAFLTEHCVGQSDVISGCLNIVFVAEFWMWFEG